MSKSWPRSARILLLAFCLLSALPAFALTLELSEHDGDRLQRRILASETPQDADALRKLAAQGDATRDKTADGTLIPLDSTAQVAHYLRAARLSAGIYVHLPALCPEGGCSGIRFVVRARHILFGAVEADNLLEIDPAAAADASVFFTNEERPRLHDGLYVDPTLSDASADRIIDSVDRIRAAYARIADRDLARGVGAIATIARNDGGYTGFGGDSLNIIRMTFDNPRNVTEARMVDAFVTTYAHELGHKLQTPRLFELPQGRLVTEGSADFLKVIVLKRSGARIEQRTNELVSSAFDQCLQRRGPHGLLQRIESREADFSEYYDCGMVDYFALMFSRRTSEDEFVSELTLALGDPSGTPARTDGCYVLSPSCKDVVLADLMGDADHLRSRRGWFMGRLNEFASARPVMQSTAASSPPR